MTTRPELLLTLNLLGSAEFLSEAEIIAYFRSKAPDLTDPGLLHRAFDFAKDKGVLARTGNLYFRRHAVTAGDAIEFEALQVLGAPPELDPELVTMAFMIRHLPVLEHRLQVVEDKLALMQEARDATTGGSHWLQLHLAKVPRPVFEALKAKAVAVLGADAHEEAVHRHMVLVAAQILQHALQQALPGN